MKYAYGLFALLFLCGCYGKKPSNKKPFEGKPLPNIELLQADSSTYINTADIDVSKPTVLFAFEPWCPFCRAQTKSIIAQIKRFDDVNLYMICNSSYSQFKSFYDQYRLAKHPTIRAGIDKKKSFSKYFNTDKIPFIAVYGKDHKLKDAFIGKTPVGLIKEAANN